jgi:probable blue pigment (indigoidine) exporter
MENTSLDGRAFGGFAYVGLVATALAFTAWFTGLRHLSAATVGLIGLLNPVTGVLLGVLVSGDVLTVRQVVGLALVLLGIALSQLRFIDAPRVAHARSDPDLRDRRRTGAADHRPSA